MIESKKTGRKLFIEVKKQKGGGNAEERACKHHTVQFYKTMKELYGYDYHPFVTVFCDALAEKRRYTQKFPYLIEPTNYFLWIGYRFDTLKFFLEGRAKDWLSK